MWHRVAALMGRTVAELRAQMSSAEFTDWCAYYSLEPWGYEAENWRMGMVAATVANAAGRKKPLKPSDFLPRSPLRQRQTPEQMRKVLHGMAEDRDHG
jgi:hypothetical protein